MCFHGKEDSERYGMASDMVEREQTILSGSWDHKGQLSHRTLNVPGIRVCVLCVFFLLYSKVLLMFG